jgi:hypothetical protein
MRLALALPNDITLELPPCICCMNRKKMTPMSTKGRRLRITLSSWLGFCGSGVNFTSGFFAIRSEREFSPMNVDVKSLVFFAALASADL